jgi:GNAT superfamily N-acetyltransferase
MAAYAYDDPGYSNLIAFNVALARWGSKGAVSEAAGVVLCAGGSWIPVVGNSAFRALPSTSGAEVVARADHFFAGLARGYSVKIRDTGADDDLRAACVAAGLEAFGAPVPEMRCDAPLPNVAAPDGVTVSIVEDAAGVKAFGAVNAEAYATYGMPTDVMHDLFDRADLLLADPAAHIVVARQGDDAVATAMIFESDGVASVQWVGTVPAARGLGLGALVTTTVTNLAFEHGAASVTLQASPMGEPVYLALGYEPLFRYTEYVRWPKPPRA